MQNGLVRVLRSGSTATEALSEPKSKENSEQIDYHGQPDTVSGSEHLTQQGNKPADGGHSKQIKHFAIMVQAAQSILGEEGNVHQRHLDYWTIQNQCIQ